MQGNILIVPGLAPAYYVSNGQTSERALLNDDRKLPIVRALNIRIRGSSTTKAVTNPAVVKAVGLSGDALEYVIEQAL